MMEPMDAQLHLLPEDETTPSPEPTAGRGSEPRRSDWRLDDSTRALGRRGVAEARSALRAAMRHRGLDPTDESHHQASAA
jgi:hypothetical protein